jgi:polyhydroxyalkanoate synthesis regulator phasin
VHHTGGAAHIEIISDNETYPADTIPIAELQRLYEADSRISTNLRNYNSDLRRDMSELKTEVFSLKRQILLLENRQQGAETP